jgi:F0F1-type ATP synthase assembly protein I
MEKPKKRPLNQILKFSNLAIQMAVIIGLGSYFGIKVDEYFGSQKVFTICLSLTAIFGSLFYVIKEVKKLQ